MFKTLKINFLYVVWYSNIVNFKTPTEKIGESYKGISNYASNPANIYVTLFTCVIPLISIGLLMGTIMHVSKVMFISGDRIGPSVSTRYIMGINRNLKLFYFW